MTTFAAFGIGLATRVAGTGKVLDTWYPLVGTPGDDEPDDDEPGDGGPEDGHPGDGTGSAGALALAKALRYAGGTLTSTLTPGILDGLELRPDDDVARTVTTAISAASGPEPTRTERVPVATFIGDLSDAPLDAHDVYLRLHLLSHRLVPPHGANLDGAFGKLSNVVWTDQGPCEPDGFEELRLQLQAAGHRVRVTSVDKFPRMTDYVVPAGVRIADADRVRLGAHLAAGTTVMHEGFVNFNAGTLGSSMVEGRISAGVVIGDGSDIGGSASIMGTLSGGGSEVIRIGQRSLVGANAGVGISLGDDCVVEAGLYVTAGTKVALPDGTVVKARELSGRDGLLFLRHSQTGQVLVREREGTVADWGGLNAALHAND